MSEHPATDGRVAHTPGPWDILQPRRNGLFHIETQIDNPVGAGIHIASVTANHEADANLIAAAPDLLDACIHAEAVLSIVEPRSDKAQYLALLVKLRSVLEKARG